MKRRLKVAIADDEPMVCVVIQSSIDFDGIGLELVGTVHDGLALLEIVDKELPDIVITDINMPGISGLELIKEIKQRDIDCRFIVISGYSQFEYARSALKYRVEDYLLKPIDPEELNDILAKTKASILSEQENKSKNTTVFENYEHSKEALSRLFLSRILDGYATFENSDTVYNEYGISFCEGFFQGAIAKLDITGDATDADCGLQSIQLKIIRMFTQIFSEYCNQTLYHQDSSQIYICINFDGKELKLITEKFEEFYVQAKNVIDLFKGLQLTVGVGSCYESIIGIKKTLEEAQNVIYYRILIGVNRVLFHNKLQFRQKRFSPDSRRQLLKRLQKNFESFDSKDFLSCMNELYSDITPEPIEMFSLSYDIVDLFFIVHEQLQNKIENSESINFSKEA